MGTHICPFAINHFASTPFFAFYHISLCHCHISLSHQNTTFSLFPHFLAQHQYQQHLHSFTETTQKSKIPQIKIQFLPPGPQILDPKTQSFLLKTDFQREKRMEAAHEDGGEGGMQCDRHPFRNSSPSGGICASCLQEKLGKLVSSSYAVAVFPSSASSSPSSRSAAAAADSRATSSGSSHHHPRKLPFASKKKSKEERSSEMVFKRSKSTATPRRGGGLHFFDQDYKTPTKRRFWKFLHYSKHPTSRKGEKHVKNLNFSSSTTDGERKRDEFVAVDDNEATFDRKVSRSRSVGCGSRSFSGDFFERISTGFGDCTLRRVESQREGKPKMKQSDCSRQRVRCGGIFGGFGLTSSSSSSHLIAASDRGGKSMVGLGHHLSHGRSKSWGWALASPMRAFGKSSAVKRGDVSAKNAAPNLAAIPSLLAVGG